MSIFTHTNTLNLLMLRRQVGPDDPRVSGSNPGGSGVEFWHQADFLIIWNSIRAPPSSWVTRTCQCSRQESVTPRGGSAGSGNQTPGRRIDTLHFDHLATVTGKNSTG